MEVFIYSGENTVYLEPLIRNMSYTMYDCSNGISTSNIDMRTKTTCMSLSVLYYNNDLEITDKPYDVTSVDKFDRPEVFDGSSTGRISGNGGGLYLSLTVRKEERNERITIATGNSGIYNHWMGNSYRDVYIRYVKTDQASLTVYQRVGGLNFNVGTAYVNGEKATWYEG